ncbi:MAG: molybdenum cofactor biosynthesis protein MoaE [bacterium]
MIKVTEEPIDVNEAFEALSKQGAGSTVLHVGVVKPDPEGKKSAGITFRPQEGIEKELKEIDTYLYDNFELTDVVLVRRMGKLKVGDLILVAAVAARDRDSAFQACREAVERFKKMENLQKQEHYLE